MTPALEEAIKRLGMQVHALGLGEHHDITISAGSDAIPSTPQKPALYERVLVELPEHVAYACERRIRQTYLTVAQDFHAFRMYGSSIPQARHKIRRMLEYAALELIIALEDCNPTVGMCLNIRAYYKSLSRLIARRSERKLNSVRWKLLRAKRFANTIQRLCEGKITDALLIATKSMQRALLKEAVLVQEKCNIN